MAGESTGRREESVQFSLQELLKLEDERLQDQKRAAAREREEEERRRREEDASREREDAERRASAQRLELDALARREAMQKAIVEQARLEVEVRARAEERDRERQHELAIERLRGERRAGPSLGALAAAAGLGGGVMLAVGLAVVFGVTKPAADRRLAELEAELGTASALSTDLTRQLDERARTLADRERQLADARRELEASRTRVPAAPALPRASSTPRSAAPTAQKVAPEPDCQPGDPMCFSVDRGARR